MLPDSQMLSPGQVASPTLALTQNRVLRNTYALLALSMVPTIFGAWLGIQFKLDLFATHPAMGLLAFFAIAVGFMYGVQRTKNSGWGVVLLLGFTFFMGIMLARMLGAVMSLTNGASLIALAFGGTSIIFVSMATLASTVKRDLSGMGKFLFVGVIMLLVAGIANIFLQSSAFMLYDIKRVIDGGETNYISATLAIYLDLYNVFQSLLALLGFAGGERD